MGWSDGFATVLTVDTGTWAVTAVEKEMALEFDIDNGETPAIAKVDDSHYLCTYTGHSDYGFAGVFEVSEEILPDHIELGFRSFRHPNCVPTLRHGCSRISVCKGLRRKRLAL